MDHGPIDRDDQINSDIDAMYELQREKAIWEEKMRARHQEPTETLWQLYLDTKKVRAGSTARLSAYLTTVLLLGWSMFG